MNMKNQILLSKILFMAITTVFLLSCNTGSKSSKDSASAEDQTESPDFQISLA